MRDYGPLRTLCTSDGHVASLYLRLAAEPLGTGQEPALRWRALQLKLLDEGATAEELRTLDERVTASQQAPRTLVAFARGGRLDYAEELVDCDLADTAGYGLAPVVVPLLQWRQQWVPHVTVRIDRTGGDIAAFVGTGDPVETEQVVGLDDEIERNAPGGWAGLAQPRYQRRAEDSWAHNAGQVAAHVTRLAAHVHAKVVLTAGDVRAVQLLAERLPTHLRTLHRPVTDGLEQVDAGRVRIRQPVVRALVHEAAARLRAEVVASFGEARGTKRAVEGLEDTLESLRRGAVGHLLVVRPAVDERLAWVWPDPLRLAVIDAAAGKAEDGAERAPLADAMVRAALAQDGDVTVVTEDEAVLADGFGALVRFPAP